MPDPTVLAGMAAAAALFALGLAARGALVLAAGFVAWLALRRASAAARHLAWTATFAALLALPVLAAALPAWRVPVLPPEWLPRRDAVRATLPAHVPVVQAVEVVSTVPTSRAPERGRRPARAETVVVPAFTVVSPDRAGALAAHGPARPGWGALLPLLALGVWAAGAELVLLSLAFSALRVRLAGRRALPLAEGRARALLPRLMARAGVRGPVLLLEGDDAAMPLTWGVRRPRILLPAAHRDWPADRLEAVLLHELAHVRRRDCLTQVLAGAACALHWWNPLAWLALRRLRLEAEHACDDRVLAAGAPAQDYAGHLLEVVRALRTPRPASIAAVAMARPSQLRTRLLAVLSSERRRGAVPPRVVAAALAGAGLAAVPLAVLSLGARGAEEPHAVTVAATRVVAHVDTVVVLTTTTRTTVRAGAPVSCGPVRGRRSTRDATDGESWSVSWWEGRCQGSARLQGKMEFEPGGTGVLSMGRGATLRLELRDARGTGRVELSAAGDGVSRRWWRNGQLRPWGPEARAWLAAALPELLRRTSYDETHGGHAADAVTVAATGQEVLDAAAAVEARAAALDQARAALEQSLRDPLAEERSVLLARLAADMDAANRERERARRARAATPAPR